MTCICFIYIVWVHELIIQLENYTCIFYIHTNFKHFHVFVFILSSAMSIAESSKLPGYGEENTNGSVSSFTLSLSNSATSFSSGTGTSTGASSRNSSFTQRAGHHPMWNMIIFSWFLTYTTAATAFLIFDLTRKNNKYRCVYSAASRRMYNATTPLRIQVCAQPLNKKPNSSK